MENSYELFIKYLAEGMTRIQSMRAAGVTYEMYSALKKEDPDMWLRVKEAEAFGADVRADELLNVHNKLSHKQAEVYSANARWHMSKRARETYGEKVEVNQTSNINILAVLEDVNKRALEHMAVLNAVRQKPEIGTIDAPDPIIKELEEVPRFRVEDV